MDPKQQHRRARSRGRSTSRSRYDYIERRGRSRSSSRNRRDRSSRDRQRSNDTKRHDNYNGRRYFQRSRSRPRERHIDNEKIGSRAEQQSDLSTNQHNDHDILNTHEFSVATLQRTLSEVDGVLEQELHDDILRLFKLDTRIYVDSILEDTDEKTKLAQCTNLAESIQSRLQVLKSSGFTYDPYGRHFRTFLPNIDHGGADIPMWFFFRPYCHNDATSSNIEPTNSQPQYSDLTTPCIKCTRKYRLRILSVLTQQYPRTVELLETHLPRRYYDRTAHNISVLVIASTNVLDDRYSHSQDSSCRIETIIPDSQLGVNANNWLRNQMAADMVVICQQTFDTHSIDNFIPTYPTVVEGALMLTPIQLIQLNGCSSAAQTYGEVVASLLHRTTQLFGAILVGDDASCVIEPGSESLPYTSSGLNDNTRYPDGRHVVLDPKVRVGRHVQACAHGWFSYDTKFNLYCALNAVKPRVILELGTWYGLSSRFIVQNAPPGSHIFFVDRFSNVGINQNALQNLTPEDKLFFNFPRYESFVSGIEHARSTLEDPARVHIHVLTMDIHESIQYLQAIDMVPDLVFVDAEKKTKPLITLLTRCFAANPRVTVVGDDYVFPSVRNAVSQFGQSHRLRPIIRDCSYIVTSQDRVAIRSFEQTFRVQFGQESKMRSMVNAWFESKNADIVEANIEKLKGIIWNQVKGEGNNTIAQMIAEKLIEHIRNKDNATPYRKATATILCNLLDQVSALSMNEMYLSIFDQVRFVISFK